MGPPSRDRGDGIHAHETGLAEQASMAPRSSVTAEMGQAVGIGGALYVMLQWGRSHVTTETHQPLLPGD